MTMPGSASDASAQSIVAVVAQALGSPQTRVFVDTSGWANPILQNTANTTEMVAVYRALMNRQQRLVTTNYVLTEALALLTARRAHGGTGMTRLEILDYIEDIQALPWVRVRHIDKAIHQEAWQMLRAAPDKGWSWVDASSFVVMRHMGITHALTSDHHFAQAGFVPLPLQSTQP